MRGKCIPQTTLSSKYSNIMITRRRSPEESHESRGSPMVASSAVVQDAEVEVQTAVQHFWTLLSILHRILLIRKLRTRSIIIFFTHQRTSEGIIKLMISQRKMMIGSGKCTE